MKKSLHYRVFFDLISFFNNNHIEGLSLHIDNNIKNDLIRRY